MFKWLLSWLKSSQPVQEERRAVPRQLCTARRHQRLLASVGSSGWPAVVEDLSTTGVGLVVGMRQEPGTWVQLRLINLTRDVSCPVQAQVVHTERCSDGYWHSGCVFEGPLQTRDLEALL